MPDLSPFIISENSTIIDALRTINENRKGIVFVCKDNVTLATLTDGDVRRHIISGKLLTAPVSEAANYRFHSLPFDTDAVHAHDICNQLAMNVIPGIDQERRLVTLFFRDERAALPNKKIDVPVVIMAGGKGSRLHPYTRILPKPLIPIGDETITERIIHNFTKYGCNKFTIIVNYMKEMIKAYFHENYIDNVSINFVDESESLGTGGGLSLLRDVIKETFFFSNCDILISGDYSDMYERHKDSGNLLTIVCATKTFTFPYGTLELDERGYLKSITEKPVYSFLANTGFYIIEPEFFDYVPDGKFIHITDIIQNYIDKNGGRVGIYPVGEDEWMDMGNHEDMEKMISKLDIII
ncbi:MAG: NTP transferase domain-containing protein [Bacteroidales bacterium]|jgi:dTDP-glucose pyrophosphorylase|nr:NTP transferase domain-containing protein [Bacteroidales bacterium]